MKKSSSARLIKSSDALTSDTSNEKIDRKQMKELKKAFVSPSDEQSCES